MKYLWEDLPEKKSCFTSRNTVLRDLNTNEIIQYYSANTKLVVVQKCITDTGTFYRTESAFRASKDYAFEGTALGLSDEVAPPSSSDSYSILKSATSPRADKTCNKHTSAYVEFPSGGERTSHKSSWFKKLFKHR